MSQEITSEAKTFLINVNDDLTPLPTFYVGNDETKVLSCARNADTPTIAVTCTQNDINMPKQEESNPVQIYYKPACGSLTPTGIYIKKTLETNTQIIISAISLDEANSVLCSTSGITNVYFTSSGSISGQISGSLKDSNDIPHSFTSCSSEETTITCMITELDIGTYYFEEIKTDDNSYTLTIEASVSQTFLNYKSISSSLDSLGELVSQEISKAAPNFLVPLEDNTKAPAIFIGSSSNTALSCSPISDTNNIECVTDDTSMPESKDVYEIWYQPACGDKVDTTIRVAKKAVSIEVDTLVINDDSKSKCITNAVFTSVQINLKTDMSSLDNSFKATLQDISNPQNTYNFSSCIVNDIRTITCSQGEVDTNKLTEVGSYSLSLLVGTTTETYTVNQMSSNKIEYAAITSILGDNKAELEKSITTATEQFTIVLGDETNAIPLFFIGNNELKPIVCGRKESPDKATLTCTVSDDSLPNDGVKRDIYMKGACDTSLSKTTLSITKGTASTFAVQTISLASDSETICALTTTTKIYFTTNTETSGTITGELVDENKKISITECTIETTNIESTLTNVENGNYKLSTLGTTSDTFNIDTVKNTVLKI